MGRQPKNFFKTNIYYSDETWNLVANWLLRNKIRYYRLERYDGHSIGVRFKTESDCLAFKLAHGKNDNNELEKKIYGIGDEDYRELLDREMRSVWGGTF